MDQAPAPPPSGERRKPRADTDPPAERPKRRFLDWLRADQEAPAPTRKSGRKAEKVEAAAAAAEAAPERPRRVGNWLMRVLGGERRAAQPALAEPAPETAALRAEPQAAAERPPAPEGLLSRTVEGAKSLGQNVLRLVDRVREGVRAADTADSPERPTDVQPLARAERKVEAALDDLDEATETLWSSRGSFSAEGDGGDGGGDADPIIWKLRVAQEAAAARAWLDTERQIEEERRQKLYSSVHQVGALAVGATLLAGGGLVYTWLKTRGLRKEQQRLEERVKEQQKELVASKERIADLERRPVSSLDRTERQTFVREVSKYASSKAEQIEQVAGDVRERANRKPIVAERPVTAKLEQLTPAQKPIEKLTPLVKDGIERLSQTVGDVAHDAKQVAGGVVFGVSQAIEVLVGGIRRPSSPTPQAAKLPYRVADPVQLWLNGVLLVLGVLLVVAILFAIF